MTRARVLGALGGVAVVACWLSAGVAPLGDALAGVGAPTDFVRDYVTARVRLEGGRGSPPVGARGNEWAARLGAPGVPLLGGPYHLHPPPALLPVLAVAWMPWREAALAWALMSLAALAWLAWSLAGLWAPERRPRWPRVVLLTTALALWPPTLHCLEKGQWSIWLAALLAAGHLALERGQPRRAGAWLGVAASLKATPLVMLGLLVARSRRAATTMLATVGTLALVATAIEGVAPWRAFFADAPRDVAAWATWLANTASLQGVYARLLTSGPFSSPLVVAPAASRAAFALTIVALLVALVAVAWRRRRAIFAAAADDRARALWSAAWLTLPVLLNPLGWSHVVLMLLAPLVVTFREGGPRARAAAIVAFAALSLPRQTLLAWAGPMPVSAGAGLVLGVHAVAGLVVFITLLVASARAPERRLDVRDP